MTHVHAQQGKAIELVLSSVVAKLKNKLYPPLHMLFFQMKVDPWTTKKLHMLFPDESTPMDYTKHAPLIIVFLPDKI